MRKIVTGALLAGILAFGMTPESRADGGVGSVAPDFQLDDVRTGASGTFSLSEYRGSIVVIAFFAYW